jgi:2-dehydro-3-deoxygluconokinase
MTANPGQPEILALGEPLIEFSALEAGEPIDGARFVAGCGGDTCNFVVAVARLGGSAGYITRIGDDPFAALLRARWETENVDTRFVEKDPAARTGIYFITRDEAGHQFTYYRQDSAASRITPDRLPRTYIRDARWLHVTGISQAISATAADTVSAAVNIARQSGTLVSYDPNLRLKLWPLARARDIIHRTLAGVDILLPSYEDACQLTGMQDPEQIVRCYLGMGPQIVVLKMGAQGALLGALPADGGASPTIRHFAPYEVEAVDTSGAGDTFDAAFTVAFLAGRPLAACVPFANAAAALVTTGIGTISPIPDARAVRQLMAQSTPAGPPITGVSAGGGD